MTPDPILAHLDRPDPAATAGIGRPAGSVAERRADPQAPTSAAAARAHLLMCPPDHFAVSYRINPWMEPGTWARRALRLQREARLGWHRLVRTYERLGARVHTMPAVDGLPDLVFTANAAFVLDGRALLARFLNPERAGETPHDARALESLRDRSLLRSLHPLPPGVRFEGAGDAAWDAHRQLVWAGWGQRSDEAARETIEAVHGVPVVSLRLVSPRFYHLDTCLTVLSGGEILWYPAAFDPPSREAVRRRAAGRLVEVDESDAGRLAVNAVCLGRDLVMGHCSEPLRARLAALGYTVHTVPMGAFNRSGGSALCLTLRLDAARGDGALARPASV